MKLEKKKKYIYIYIEIENICLLFKSTNIIIINNNKIKENNI